MHNNETIARLTDRIAGLPDAPDRTRHEWFYTDVARLAAAAIDDAIAREMADHAAVQAEEAFNDGHDAGYRRGLEDGRAETRRPPRTPSAAVPHRTADRTTPVSRLDAHQVARRGRNNGGRGGRGGIA